MLKTPIAESSGPLLRRISRAIPVLISASLLSAANGAEPGGKSEWVSAGPNGKLTYKTTATGDKIMDFSTAGYMGGGVPLPSVPVKRTLKPSGKDDNTATIQAAINEVAALPVENGFRGAVLLKAGVYPCSSTIYITASGVVLRGSGSGASGSTIEMSGGRHTAINAGGRRNRGQDRAPIDNEELPDQGESAGGQSFIADSYVPSGAISFAVADAKGFSAGDTIEIRHPVTAAWVKFMGMDNLTRNGKPQTWLRAGATIPIERRIASVAGKKITLDVPLSDSFDSQYLNPPGTAVVKVRPPTRLTQIGIEHLHIESPLQQVNHTEELYTAVRLSGQDCWMQDVNIDETMNSVGISGRRITLEKVTVNRKALHLGASKPAEFAPNGDQILLDRCSVNADNVWFAATGSGHSGPIVFLNCTFGGNGHIEGHMRWTTGMLLDNCSLPDGGIDFKNRGAMGSGHGWGMGWAVAWNCTAKSYVVQQPPGAFNWAIGCIGERELMSRPFDSEPKLPEGTFDSDGKPVRPQSLYLAQLSERLGPKALKAIEYSSPTIRPGERATQSPRPPRMDIDKDLGPNLALLAPVNTSNVREGKREFAGEMAVDGNGATYWAANDTATNATLELDMPGPTEINAVLLGEPRALAGHIQEYKVEAQVNSDWKLLTQGTTIGDRKVDHFPKVTVWKVRLTILKSASYPALRNFGLYLDRHS